MSSKKVGVFGIYSTRVAVENATDSLVRAGFPAADVSVLLPQSLGGPKDMGAEKATKAPEGAAAGVTTGGIIGGTLGLLAGVGLLAIPGLGPFIAAGPIMAGLTGLGVGGAVGGVTGALIGMGIPEFEVKRSRSMSILWAARLLPVWRFTTRCNMSGPMWSRTALGEDVAGSSPTREPDQIISSCFPPQFRFRWLLYGRCSSTHLRASS